MISFEKNSNDYDGEEPIAVHSMGLHFHTDPYRGPCILNGSATNFFDINSQTGVQNFYTNVDPGNNTHTYTFYQDTMDCYHLYD